MESVIGRHRSAERVLSQWSQLRQYDKEKKAIQVIIEKQVSVSPYRCEE